MAHTWEKKPWKENTKKWKNNSEKALSKSNNNQIGWVRDENNNLYGN